MVAGFAHLVVITILTLKSRPSPEQTEGVFVAVMAQAKGIASDRMAGLVGERGFDAMERRHKSVVRRRFLAALPGQDLFAAGGSLRKAASASWKSTGQFVSKDSRRPVAG